MKKLFLIILIVSMLCSGVCFASRQSDVERQVRRLLDYDLEVLQLALELKICQKYKGAVVISYDSITNESTFLGKIENEFSSDSIFNELGRYGSDISSTSIWNDICKYGNDISSCSAFNDIATNPPMIIKNREVIGYITVNDLISGGIDPFLLKFYFLD